MAKRLPKRILGRKVPKHLRKGELGRFLASGFGQNVTADAIVTVLAALVAGGAKNGPRLTHALAAAAESFSRAVSEGRPRGQPL